MGQVGLLIAEGLGWPVATIARAADLEVIRTAREHLRPQAEPPVVSPGASRADLHAALIHRPPEKGARPDVPGL